MHTLEYNDGTLTIFADGVLVRSQPFDPRTQEPWADAATAEAWALQEIKDMQGTPSRKVSPLSFMRRFTLEEHTAVLTAAQSNMTVRAIYDRMMMAGFIDLEDLDVQNGLLYFYSENLVSEERMTAILNAPVLSTEMP